MPPELDYARRKDSDRPRLARYVPFLIPVAAILSFRLFYSTVASLIAQAQHPVDMLDYARLLWHWENRLLDAMFVAMDVTFVLLIVFSVFAIIPKSRYWFNARVQGWTFLLILNWLIVICVGTSPITNKPSQIYPRRLNQF